ncbi:MFS transporter [Geodermatophilus sp. SYSU D00700]
MNNPRDSQAPAVAGRREWLGLGVLALPTLLLAIDVSVLYLALPQLAVDLGADATEQLWITDIYGFLIAGFLIPMGTLGDRWGRRKLLLAGAAAFGVFSVVAAFSTSPLMLIGARAALGIAGATLMPSTMALIGSLFVDPRERAKALAIWSSCFMGGAALGPVVGGVLLDTFWWGAAFLLGVPVMVLLLIVGPRVLPRDDTSAEPMSLDSASVLLLLSSVLLAVYGIKELAVRGGTVPGLALAAGLALGAVFVRRQRSLRHPLLDLGLFRERTLSAAVTVGVVTGMVMGGMGLLVSVYLQTTAGLSPLAAGLWQLPSTFVMIAAAMTAPAVAARFRPVSVIAAGLVVSAAGLLLWTALAAGAGLAVLVCGYVLLAAGIGLGLPLGQGLVLESAPPERAGSASALAETGGELGLALGIATLGTVAAAVYQSRVTVPPLPESAAQTARGSVSGALDVAAQLPSDTGRLLEDSARTAFADGLGVTAALAAVLLTGLSMIVLRLLGGRQSPSAPGQGQVTAERRLDGSASPESGPASESPVRL